MTKSFIYASRLPASSRVLYVKKTEGGLQFCVNYWVFNIVTIKSRYLFPLIQETFNCLCHTKIYTKLDIISAFNLLCIREKDESFTEFYMRFDLFEYVVILFEHCSKLASF